MRPVLKWAGGKSRLAPQIALAMAEPCEGTYFEPFIGSAAVFLHLKSVGMVGDAVLADVNPKLAETHRALRDCVDDVLTELANLPSDDCRERYYEIRDAYNYGPWHGPRHAARLLWLNRAGYNGLYRENKSGKYNVPVGSYASLKLPSEERFREVSEALFGVEIRCADFAEILALAGTDDQVYCDPPYVPLSATARFTGYCALPFGLGEQRRLALAARSAAFRGARVVLSNHDLPVVRNELYPSTDGFQYVARPRVARAISRKATRREAVGEVIAAIGPLAGEAA